MAADFYPVLSRAIAGLDPNTEDARAVLFARARQALTALPSTKLSGARLDLSAELAALEAAIERLEWENRPDQATHTDTQPLAADFAEASQFGSADTRSVDTSESFLESGPIEAHADEPNIADSPYASGLVDNDVTEYEDYRESPSQEAPASSQDWPALTSEGHKDRGKRKVLAVAAAVLFFGGLGYVGFTGGPSDFATGSVVQPSIGSLSKLQVYGINLRMDGHAAAAAVAKFLQAEYGPIQDRLWDWKVCSPEAEKAMSADGVDRTGWLKKYCFAIISFGEVSSVDRARLHLVEDPASHKSIVGSFQLTLGSNSKAVDPELILRDAISQYGEPRHIRSPGGRSGRCLVWGGDEQAYLEFCTDACCVAITFEDRDLIRYATLDYGRRMGIIAQPTSQ